MRPTYVTLTSSGSSPWQIVNWHVTPISIGMAVRTNGLAGGWQIDITMDDPTNVYPAPFGTTVFQSSMMQGQVGLSGSSWAIGVITQPIAAWRLTTLGSGTATVTALQAGIS